MSNDKIIGIQIGNPEATCECTDRAHLHSIFAWVQVAPNGEEAVIGFIGPLGPDRCMGYDIENATQPQFTKVATMAAKAMERPVYLRRYDLAATVQTIQ